MEGAGHHGEECASGVVGSNPTSGQVAHLLWAPVSSPRMWRQPSPLKTGEGSVRREMVIAKGNAPSADV